VVRRSPAILDNALANVPRSYEEAIIPTTPHLSSTPAQYRDSYRSACIRLEQHIDNVACAKGLRVTVRLGPSWAAVAIPAIHTVTLGIRKNETIVCIDHESFMEDEEFVGNFVLPQISDAIEKLVGE
jgi:hypothetical protein